MSRTPEKHVQDHIAGVCASLGIAHYHTHRSEGSDAGFLDSFCVGPGGCVVIEAKRQDGKTTAEQDLWMWLFTEILGVTALVRRPEHTLNRAELGGKTQIQVDLEAIARGPGGTRFPKHIADAIVTLRSGQARQQFAAIKRAAARRS